MKPKCQDWQTPQRLALLRGWAREDLPPEEIARRCGVSRRVLERWRRQSQQIDQALAQSRELADRVMEDARYLRATGYTTTV